MQVQQQISSTDGEDNRVNRLALMHRQAGLMLGRLDHVTRLPNRIQFIDDLEIMQRERNANAEKKILLLCTLAEAQHYNEILRALGHAYSEDFVCNGASRIIENLPDCGTIYHVSVLSFATFLPSNDRQEAEKIVTKLSRAFDKPIDCQSIPVSTKVGTGLSQLGGEFSDPSELLRSCLAAAQDSRSSELGWSWYDRKADEAHLRAFQILADLEPAIKSGQGLKLHFQPRIDMRSQRCISAEALLRWQHPELGFISPEEFIPLAEATALITPLTQWVVTESIKQAARWQIAGMDLKISINVSPKNLAEPAFVDFLKHQCDCYKVNPSRIELEFTESMMAPKNHQLFKTMSDLQAIDVEIAIDDFGSGYSNMSYLTNLPAKTLKIDQSFIRPMDNDRRKRQLVQSIIELGHNLDFRLVAEGIETAASYDKLVEWDCDEGQGYYMSRPLESSVFETWFRGQKAA